MSITQNSEPHWESGKGITNENEKMTEEENGKKSREHNLFRLVTAQEIGNVDEIQYTLHDRLWLWLAANRRRFPLHLIKILAVRQSEENNLFYEIYSIRSEIESIANCIAWNWCCWIIFIFIFAVLCISDSDSPLNSSVMDFLCNTTLTQYP